MDTARVRDLLVSYAPTYVESREQAFALESSTYPISGGDSYYEDFTEGLRHYVQSRPMKIGGGGGAAFVLTLSGGSGNNFDDDFSDDEIDAWDYKAATTAAPDTTVASILAFEVAADPMIDGGGNDSKKFCVSNQSIAGEITDSPPEHHFSSDTRSMLEFVTEVPPLSSAGMINESSDVDDGTFVIVDNFSGNDVDATTTGEMDESELEHLTPNFTGETETDMGASILTAVVPVSELSD